MSTITLEISDELAERLQPVANRLPLVIEMGLRELYAAGTPAFEGATEVLEFLASLPAPREILALRPSRILQRRIDGLLEKNRTQGLTPEEEEAWKQYEYLEHLVRMAKAKAHLKLNADG